MILGSRAIDWPEMTRGTRTGRLTAGDSGKGRVVRSGTMSALHEMKCEVCRVGAPPVTEEEKARYLKEVPDWQIVEVEGVSRLRRVFRFPDFSGALAFTDLVGAAAESEGHHPSLLTEWGKVTVSWWTHKIKGLHRNDFIMAARTDRLFEKAGKDRSRP